MDAYILGGLRSYIGIENGMYKNIPAEKLGAEVLKAVLNKFQIQCPDMIIAGNAMAGGGNICRLMALETGLNNTVPCFTIDLQCGSGLEAIITAAEKIKCGSADVIIAGGFESCSTAPVRSLNVNHPEYNIITDNIYKTARFSPDSFSQTVMIEGAENAGNRLGASRKELNRFVLESHKKACIAREQKLLEDICIQVCTGKRSDEGIRNSMNEKFLDRVPGILSPEGISTIGNCCLTNDGAAFIVICSERFLKGKNIKPIARFISSTHTGIAPEISPLSCTCAISALFEKNNILPDEIGVYELNEAFAIIDYDFSRKFPECRNKLNIFGGALAYGHAYGASGAVITLHALKALEYKNEKLAIISIAAAGGLGTAILIERM